MELIYVWIEDYKNIHHQGFNFSPRYRFEFELTLSDDKKSVIGGTLTEELEEKFKTEPEKETKIAEARRTRFPDKFFGEGITNVTAIVGQNGAGKSSLIEATLAILGLLSEDHNIDFNFIIVFLDNELNFHTSEKFNINIESIQILKNGKCIAPENFSGILLSNVFDGNYLSFKKDELNLSTNSLLRTTEGKINPIEKYIQEEFIRQIEFSSIFSNNDLGLDKFNIPKKITIGMWTNISNWFFGTLLTKLLIKNPFADEESNHGGNVYKFINNKEKTFENIIAYRILYFLIAFPFNLLKKEKKSGDADIAKKFIEFIEQKTEFNNPLEIVIEFITDLQNNSQDLEKKKYLRNLRNFAFHCKKLGNLIKKSNVEKNYITFLCNEIDIYNVKLFKNFFRAYKNAYTIPETSRVIMNRWEGMSSGQLAIMNIFSRFYSVKTKIKEKSILIFIDEGELYLHAEWQKQFLNSLLKVLPRIFNDVDGIQIILTSHTPFVLSDIPRENVIFLKQAKSPEGKDVEIVNGREYKKGQCIVIDGLKDKEQTFGANIHTLLSDTFFLKDGLIGAFAKGKIKNILDFYREVKKIEEKLIEEKVSEKSNDKEFNRKENEYKEEKKESFWKIQSMIGEKYLAEIVKNHLEEIEFILNIKPKGEEEIIEDFLKNRNRAKIQEILDKLKKLEEENLNDKN